MCTGISFKTRDHYFGRNLDLEYSYEESVTITPKNYHLKFRKEGSIENHFAMIGMAYVKENYPLYYDATNEKGLSVAALNFPGNAKYRSFKDGMYNITPFELIPWVLSQCKNIQEASVLLKKTNLYQCAFSDELPLTPLHFLVSDGNDSIVVEPLEDGLCISDNPVGVLTNNPEFKVQMFQLNHYIGLSKKEPINTFSKELNLETYSRGMGALGLPGDLSSASRFVRASFIKMNSICGQDECESVNQFFHILGAVEQQKGCVKVGKNDYEYTIYSSCCNTDKGIYYYKTYNNCGITAVNMNNEPLGGNRLISFPLNYEQKICWQN